MGRTKQFTRSFSYRFWPYQILLSEDKRIHGFEKFRKDISGESQEAQKEQKSQDKSSDEDESEKEYSDNSKAYYRTIIETYNPYRYALFFYLPIIAILTFVLIRNRRRKCTEQELVELVKRNEVGKLKANVSQRGLTIVNVYNKQGSCIKVCATTDLENLKRKIQEVQSQTENRLEIEAENATSSGLRIALFLMLILILLSFLTVANKRISLRYGEAKNIIKLTKAEYDQLIKNINEGMNSRLGQEGMWKKRTSKETTNKKAESKTEAEKEPEKNSKTEAKTNDDKN